MCSDSKAAIHVQVRDRVSSNQRFQPPPLLTIKILFTNPIGKLLMIKQKIDKIYFQYSKPASMVYQNIKERK